MRVLGVIDLRGGVAVHASGGERADYAPVRAAAGHVVDGDPVALARAYRSLGLDELYVADLDAIGGSPTQDAAITAIAEECRALWLDAGISTVEDAEYVLALGATTVVVGFETLRSYAALADICRDVGGHRVAFSLDLRNGVPIGHDAGTPEAVVARAVEAGATTVIVLELARVGSGTGPDLDLIARVRRAAPGASLLAAGGVRDAGDLAHLADAGCDGALVATALHTGALRPNHGSATR